MDPSAKGGAPTKKVPTSWHPRELELGVILIHHDNRHPSAWFDFSKIDTSDLVSKQREGLVRTLRSLANLIEKEGG